MSYKMFLPIPFSILLLTVACGGPDPTATPTSLPTPTPTATAVPTPTPTMHVEKLRLLALGDSYTIGHNVAVSERWPVQLVQRLRQKGLLIEEPDIIARTGWTTNELSLAIDVAKPRGRYDLVTLMIGVNNQYRSRAVEEFRAEFAALLQRAVAFTGERPSHVVVLSIPDWSITAFAEGRDRAKIAMEIELFNAIIRGEVSRNGVRYVDVTPISHEAEKDSKLLASDGLHPSGKMYEAWTELILPEALAILNSQ